MNSDKSLFSLVRQNAPMFIGMLVMFVCSMLYCASSAMFGRLGDATGVLLFGHMVGNISRYCDPFIMGVFAGIVTYLWGKVPPKSRFIRSRDLGEVAVWGFCAFSFLLLWSRKYPLIFFESLGCSYSFMTCLVFIVISPLGTGGAYFSTVISAAFLLFSRGSVPAVLFVTLVYIGKWINWWMVNIIRHGFTGAKSALKSSGDAGAVVQQS